MQFTFALASLFLLPSLILSSPLLVERQSPLSNPLDDPFYKASTIPSTKGTIIKSRNVSTIVSDLNLKRSYQVLYSTTNTQLQREATVATIFTPKSPASPPRIVSYQAYTDAVSADCAPSWALVKGSASQSTATVETDGAIYIETFLASGYYVVVSDNYGPKAAFIAGHQEGMAVLDGVRATIKSEKLSNSQVAMLGYSGGASSTVWATNLASTYAKELKIVGAAMGGTPIDTTATFTFLNGGAFAGFAGAGALGVANAYPDFYNYLQSKATTAGLAKLAQFRSRGYCIGSVVSGSPFVNFLDYFTENVLQSPITKKILAKETLLKSVSSNPSSISTPKFPRFNTHALEDEIVPYQGEASYVTEQCLGGANIAFTTLPAAEHISAEILSVVPFIAFIQQAFAGTTPKVLCGSPIPIPPIGGPQAVGLIGQANVNKLLALNGTTTPFGVVKL